MRESNIENDKYNWNSGQEKYYILLKYLVLLIGDVELKGKEDVRWGDQEGKGLVFHYKVSTG